MSHFWIVLGQLDPIQSHSMATSKKVITREEWERKLKEVKIRKEDMNKLVMNFLVTEGYVEAAEKFRVESGTEPDIDIGTMTDRTAVKKAVQSGNVEDAIEKVNELNPEILDTNPQLYFHLQQQRLIELIRHGKVEEALEFAQEELAPRGEENAWRMVRGGSELWGVPGSSPYSGLCIKKISKFSRRVGEDSSFTGIRRCKKLPIQRTAGRVSALENCK